MDPIDREEARTEELAVSPDRTGVAELSVEGSLVDWSGEEVDGEAVRSPGSEETETPLREIVGTSGGEAEIGREVAWIRPQPVPYLEAAWDFAAILSTVTEEHLVEWRRRFRIPATVHMFLPTPEERPHLAPFGCTVVYYRSLLAGLSGHITAQETSPEFDYRIGKLLELSPEQRKSYLVITEENLAAADLRPTEPAMSESASRSKAAPARKETPAERVERLAAERKRRAAPKRKRPETEANIAVSRTELVSRVEELSMSSPIQTGRAVGKEPAIDLEGHYLPVNKDRVDNLLKCSLT
ncbi:hypothetical protein OROHE_024905 [Orobanche hederae]